LPKTHIKGMAEQLVWQSFSQISGKYISRTVHESPMETTSLFSRSAKNIVIGMINDAAGSTAG